jgi:fatty acid desaturase
MNVSVGIDPKLRLSPGEIKTLHHRPLWKPVLQSVFNVTAYASLGALAHFTDYLALSLLCWVLMGFVLSGFLGASHDCAHSSFFNSPLANRIAGGFWSSVVLFNFTIYRFYHLEHHRYTNVEGDTEPGGAFESFFQYLASLPTTSFFVSFWLMSIRACRREFPHFIRTRRQRRDVLLDNVPLVSWVFAAALLTFLWPRQLLFMYWGPMFFYFPMVFLTSLPEHYDCDDGPGLTVNTRSMHSNALFRYIFWNGNYHAEHHTYPRVPSCNLPALSRLIRPAFVNREDSYVRFHLKLITSLIRHTKDTAGPAASALKRVEFETYRDRPTSRSDGES